jgi:Glyoxalase-like domain
VSLVRRVFVTLDCADPQPLAEFWAAMLGGELVFATAQAVGVRTEHAWLSAIRVDGYRPPTWPDDTVPKQIHLDLDVEDLGAAVAAAERLGAVAARFQPAPEARRIMLDPAGHPFCLTTGVPKIEAQP